MIDEIYRVMAPSSRYVTFSLHSIEEVLSKFTSPNYQWRVKAYRVRSHRWNETEHRKRSVAHTMIICDKPDEQGNYSTSSETLSDPTKVPNILEEEEYLKLKTHAEEVS